MRIKIIIHFLSLFLLGMHKINAQVSIPVKNIDVFSHQYLTGNPWINEPYLLLNYLNRWPSALNHKSYKAGGRFAFSELNSSFGVLLSHSSQNNVFAQTNLNIGYNYDLRLNRDIKLVFGMNGIVQYNVKNFTNLTFANDNNYANERYFSPDASASLSSLILEKHFFGLNTGLLLHSENRFSELSILYLGQYKKQLGDHISLIQPSFKMYYLNNHILLNHGGSVIYRNIMSGILIDQQLPVKLNSLQIMLGINTEYFKFIYGYNINLYKNIALNAGFTAHEVTFLQKIRYKNQKRIRKAIKCPDI